MIYKVLILIILYVISFCRSSSPIYDKYIDYNIDDEGFLNHNTLQSIGVSEIRNDDENKNLIHQKCLYRAETIAKERMVSMMVHTHFGMVGKRGANSFIEDYPEKITKAEIVYWSLFFEPLLIKSYLFLEQIKDNHCKIVLRINEKNLLTKIKEWKRIDS